MATLVANTVVSDATGNVFIPLDAGPQADTDVTVIASAAVQIQAAPGTTPPGLTLPPNVPVVLPVRDARIYLKGVANVSYMYATP